MVEHVDLSKISRNSSQVFTHINLGDWEKQSWLSFGECKINNEGRICFIGSRLRGGITDPEHDSCYAVRIDLIGLTYKFSSNHTTWFEAWLSTDPKNILVYPESFDPFKVAGAHFCDYCADDEELSPHLILPERYYTPPVYEFADQVAGKRVEILYGTKF